jgi:deoxyxylulose-5-phosphate synthase
LPDKAVIRQPKDLLFIAIGTFLVQANQPKTDLIETLFSDGVIDQRVVARLLVNPDPGTLYDPHDANTCQLFDRLADGKTGDAILFG